MNFGPLELSSYLRRKDAAPRESAEVRAARDALPPQRPAANRLTIVSGPREMRRVARDPNVIPVHVYEAITTRTDATHGADPVRVVVSSVHSVVLVLSSHQSVSWRIERMPGTSLEAVLIAGCGQSRVFGAGDAQVASLGGFYAFRRGSSEFRHLEDHVRRLTGRGIARFHSACSATQFEACFE
jgi:hypothetical protein